jgi:alkyldihydroxyacetonephosphate synthase
MRLREIGVVFEPGLGGRVRAERTMRRWNGWGDEAIDLRLAGEARHFLSARIGQSSAPNDAALDAVVAKIPPSRLPGHRLVTQDRETRLRASVGQSLEDWLRLRFGRVHAVADGVAFPETEDEVREALNFAAAAGAVAIPVGGATSVVGHLTPGDGKRPALAIAMTRLRRLIKLDRVSQLATFEAGVAGPDLEAQLAAQNFVLGHYPQSFEYSTLGGWIATRSCGQQSARYGRIDALFAGGRIETPTGALDLPAFPASAAGPDLKEWVLGSEGRIGVITRATVRVSRAPERETFVGYFLPNWEAGQAATRDLVQMRLGLSMARLANPAETEATLRLAEGGGAVTALKRYLALRGCSDGKVLLLIGYTGQRAQIDAMRAEVSTLLRRRGAVSTGGLIGAKWRANRFKSAYLRNALWSAGYAVDTMETAVDWTRAGAMTDAVETAGRAALARFGERCHAQTHLSQVYPQGSSVYATFVFRLAPDFETNLERWRALKSAVSEAIVREGGTITHQHGVGRDHAPYLAADKGERGVRALQAMVDHFDPAGALDSGNLLPKASQ